jgi:hypothetical protein
MLADGSFPTISASRLYDPEWEFMKEVDPEMYEVKEMLEATKINPKVLPNIIRALAGIAWGTGYGKVQIFIENRQVSQVKPEESDRVDAPALKIDE